MSSSIHGVLDYAVSTALASAPGIDPEANGRPAAVARSFSAAATVYSLLTDYEWGAVKLLPMKTHLLLDVVWGASLAASPWLFGFADSRRSSWLPHVSFGALGIAAAALTQPYIGSARQHDGRDLHPFRPF